MIMENGQRTLILQPKISLGHSQFRTLSEGQDAEGMEGGKCFTEDGGGNFIQAFLNMCIPYSSPEVGLIFHCFAEIFL